MEKTLHQSNRKSNNNVPQRLRQQIELDENVRKREKKKSLIIAVYSSFNILNETIFVRSVEIEAIERKKNGLCTCGARCCWCMWLCM